MTASCPVCGLWRNTYWRRTPSGGTMRTIAAHYPLDDHETPDLCWGSVRELGLEDIRAAVEIAEEEGDRLRLAAHP